MKTYRKHFAVALIVGVFAFAPYLRAQDSQSLVKGRDAIVSGARQMLEGSRKIMAVLQKKGLVDDQIQALNKQMMAGYNLVMKGSGLMSGSTTVQGQEMMKQGAAMILKAHTDMVNAIQRKGMTKVCAIDLHECHFAARRIKRGALQWYFGTTGF